MIALALSVVVHESVSRGEARLDSNFEHGGNDILYPGEAQDVSSVTKLVGVKQER